MSTIYLSLLVTLVAVLLARMLIRPEKTYEFPFFMATVFAVFILPQAFSLARFPGSVSTTSVDAVLLMSSLCLLACVGGYRLSPRATILELAGWPVDPDRLFGVGLLFLAVGFFFHWRLSCTEIEYAHGGMTGAATILLFFRNLVFLGLAICLLDAVRRPRLASVMAAAAGCIIPLQIAIAGRREAAVLLGFLLLLGCYFGRRVKPPRALIPFAIVVAMLAIPATGTYRGLYAKGDWNKIRQIDLVANFKKFLTGGSILELRNAAAVIEETRATGAYQFGALYWNHLVFRYVPAQILGAEFKRMLVIGRASGHLMATRSGYRFSVGATLTGMGDSFMQFGWLGCLFFVPVAVLFRSLWQAAQRPHAFLAQLLYMTCCTTAMRCVTHWTADFLPGLLYNVVFLGIAFLYAREPRVIPSRHRTSLRPGVGVSTIAPNRSSTAGQRSLPSI